MSHGPLLPSYPGTAGEHALTPESNRRSPFDFDRFVISAQGKAFDSLVTASSLGMTTPQFLRIVGVVTSRAHSALPTAPAAVRGAGLHWPDR